MAACLPEVYRDEIELAVHAEALGFDTIWLTEHHFADDGYSPAIIPLAAAIATRTERVGIGFNLLLLPLHDAVRVADDIATLDVLSGGRIDVGVGQGDARHEFAGYGIDPDHRLPASSKDSMFCTACGPKTSSPTRDSTTSSTGLACSPSRCSNPRRHCGSVQPVPAGVRRAGRRGANLLGLTSRRLQDVYDDARREAGHDPDQAKVLQLHWTHIDVDDDAAWTVAAPPPPSSPDRLRTVARRINRPPSRPQAHRGAAAQDLRNSPPVLFTPVIAGPQTAAAALNAATAGVRSTHLAFGVVPGVDPRRTRTSLELIASDVAPQLT